MFQLFRYDDDLNEIRKLIDDRQHDLIPSSTSPAPCCLTGLYQPVKHVNTFVCKGKHVYVETKIETGGIINVTWVCQCGKKLEINGKR